MRKKNAKIRRRYCTTYIIQICKWDLNSVSTNENFTFLKLYQKDSLVKVNKRSLNIGVNFSESSPSVDFDESIHFAAFRAGEIMTLWRKRLCVQTMSERWKQSIVNCEFQNEKRSFDCMEIFIFDLWNIACDRDGRFGSSPCVQLFQVTPGIVWSERWGLRIAGVKSTHQFLCFRLIVSYPDRHLVVVALSIFKNIFVNN